MRARQKVSRAGVELIKSFEGLRSTAARLPDGRWTLGYGHTFSAREGARVTQEDADALLRFDLLPIVDALNNMVLVPLNQNQFDSLVSFCFNIGVDNFGVSTVLKRINEGRMTEAALAMDAWRSAEFNGQTYVLAPLIRRRAAEKNLFLTPEETAGNAPSLLVRPVEDAPGAAVVRPSELDAPDRGGILSAFPVGATEPAKVEPRPEPVAEPAPNHFYSPYAQPAPATFAAPVADPVVAPPVVAERIVETLPEGFMAASVMRETPVVEAPPIAFAGQDRVSDEPAPQMSAEVHAALARAQEEQLLRDEALRQSQALAAARAAEDARLQEQQRFAAAEAARLEQARLEQSRLEQERLAAEAAERQRLEDARLEQAKLEQARLEQARLEQARLEQERLDQATLEQARLEQARLEQARLEQARLEQDRLEQVRVEQARLEQARLEAEREAAAQAERERLAAAETAQVATPQPSDEEAEKIRKAEAAAALMRLYSPYGGGALGRPLSAPAARPAEPAPAVVQPVSAPVAAPSPVEEFSNQSVIAPTSALSSPIDISAHAEAVKPAPVAAPAPVVAAPPADDDEDGDGPVMAPFGVSASAMPAPVVTAINPYIQAAKPEQKPELTLVPKAAPEVVEVARPAAVDLSAPSTTAIFERPQPAETNWREQLQRPLPAGYTAPESSQSEQASLIQATPASRYDQMYDDDSNAWTMDGDRIALSSEELHEESASWGRMIVSTLWWIFSSTVGLAALGAAAAAYFKSKDPIVLRSGYFDDYMKLSVFAAAVGIFFVSVSVWLIMKRLGGLKD